MDHVYPISRWTSEKVIANCGHWLVSPRTVLRLDLHTYMCMSSVYRGADHTVILFLLWDTRNRFVPSFIPLPLYPFLHYFTTRMDSLRSADIGDLKVTQRPIITDIAGAIIRGCFAKRCNKDISVTQSLTAA